MNENNDIQIELKEMGAALQQQDSSMPYELPDPYFEQLPDEILFKIRTQYAFQQNPFSLEDKNYFNHFAETVLYRIQNEEDAAMSPALESILKKPLFEVPDDYFNENRFTDKTLKVAPESSTKGRLRFMSFSKRIALAAAAVVAIVVTFSVVNMIRKPETTNLPLAHLDETIQSGLRMDDSEFAASLEKLNDQDILQYLGENTTETDIASIENSIGENQLPGEESYLTDEHIFENFLNTTNPLSDN